MEARIETGIRSKAVGRYKLFSAIFFGQGFLLLFFSSYTGTNIHGDGNGTFPYYVPSIIISITIFIVSGVGVAIYDRGQHECEAELVPQVKPLVRLHFIVSVIVTVACVIGSILTIVFGLCPSNKCSYSINYTFNQGMAAFLLCLQLLSMATTVYSIYMFNHYRKHFVVPRKQERFAMPHGEFQSHTSQQNQG
ncbi:uncharacterized protein LOC132748034 [Ruditapes philippinarum]|uniref:uncharacterized protein LOC132748034 n=1 Tax=Ruditapes philippinarum TaxID=129788 RepID=UPI00295AF5C0|nr:uncharacterized protein LOC132748034 [Ruditapes philippinarum]